MELVNFHISEPPFYFFLSVHIYQMGMVLCTERLILSISGYLFFHVSFLVCNVHNSILFLTQFLSITWLGTLEYPSEQIYSVCWFKISCVSSYVKTFTVETGPCRDTVFVTLQNSVMSFIFLKEILTVSHFVNRFESIFVSVLLALFLNCIQEFDLSGFTFQQAVSVFFFVLFSGLYSY